MYISKYVAEFLLVHKFPVVSLGSYYWDFFDLYFILRNNHLRKYLQINNIFLNKTKEILKKTELKTLEEEIKEFLPFSFRPIIKNLRQNLLIELKRL